MRRHFSPSWLLLCAIVSAEQGYVPDDADAYLETVGVPSGLPLLSVKYKVGSWGRKVLVEGAKTELRAPADVESKPMVTWEKTVSPETSHTERYAMLMFGPDEPARASSDGSGMQGPVLHWLLLNCQDSATSCYEALQYQPPRPNPSSGDHRYIFVLFRQRANKVPPMDKISPFVSVASRERWPLKEFVSSLAESLEPVAVAWFYGSAEGPQAALAGGDGSGAGTAKPAAASPAGAAPLGLQWDHDKRPKHDEL